MSIFESNGVTGTARRNILGVWLMYLRKSRQDDPSETVEEVLAKHEAQLQEYAMRELGGKIPEECIYREVVSGESIDEREEMKKILARIEDPDVKGVLVIEPQRLSRGDLEDCGRLISDFRYTGTMVLTPMMSYDLENKMERKFFQDELLRGRDYLEYTKEILLRGRIAAVKRGCYIGTRPPYGYNKITIGRDHTLEPNENADVVRMIFKWYITEDLTPYRIAERLNDMGIPAPNGGKWKKDTIRVILRNMHYVGKVFFNRFKETTVLENGERVTKRLMQPDDEVIVAEGKHQAIIDLETWEKAQQMVARNPRVKHTYDVRNPLSGIAVCKKCGLVMKIHPYKRAEDRYECRTRPRCYKSVKESELIQAVITALELSELPEMEMRIKNGDGDAAKIQQRILERLEKQMQEHRAQEEKQFELLETGVYTREMFERRNTIIRDKIEQCQKQIYEAKASMPKNVDYHEIVSNLKAAINALRDDSMTPLQKHRIVKAVVDKIEFEGSPPVDKSKKGWKKNENEFNLKVFLRL